MQRAVFKAETNLTALINQQSTLVRAAEHFAGLDRPSTEDISKFKELFYALSLKATVGDRKVISELLARGTYTPRSVALFFAMDKPEIAASTLLFSPVLNDRDLVGIVERCGFSHSEYIACRSNIGPTVVRALLEVDDENKTLFAILKENLTVSKDTDKLIQMANSVEETVETSASKREIKAVPNRQTDAREKLLELTGRGGKLGNKTHLTSAEQEMVAQREKIGKALLAHARNRNFEAFAFDVKSVTSLPIEFTRSILESRDTGKTATILRAIGVKPIEGLKILLLLNPVLGEDFIRFREVTRQFEKLEQQKCIDYLNTIGANLSISREERQPTQTSKRRTNPMRPEVLGADRSSDIDRIDSNMLLKFAS